MKKLLYRIIAQTLSITIFVGVFMFSLFITYGYRYDFEENEIIQTSVIDICATPKKAEIYLDDEKYDEKSCSKIYGLDIGPHQIEIKKPGFYPWKKHLFLDAERASVHKQIVLIPRPEFRQTRVLAENVKYAWISPNQSLYATYLPSFNIIKIFSASQSKPKIIETKYPIYDLTWLNNKSLIADTKKGFFLIRLNHKTWQPVQNVVFRPTEQSDDLVIQNNEIWQKQKAGPKFITRYSKLIQSVQYFYNKSNLLIATENEIHICDIEGENCRLISTKDKSTSVGHPSRSKKIVFVKNGVLQQISLNGPSDDTYLEINL